MPDKILHVVVGTCGEYSDREEWPAMAFDTEDEAEDYITALSVAYRMHRAGDMYLSDKATEGMVKMDPGFRESYTGTRWFTAKVLYRGRG